jgi:hypothetical protein
MVGASPTDANMVRNPSRSAPRARLIYGLMTKNAPTVIERLVHDHVGSLAAVHRRQMLMLVPAASWRRPPRRGDAHRPVPVPTRSLTVADVPTARLQTSPSPWVKGRCWSILSPTVAIGGCS